METPKHSLGIKIAPAGAKDPQDLTKLFSVPPQIIRQPSSIVKIDMNAAKIFLFTRF